MNFKKIRLTFENWIYQKLYGHSIDINDYKIKNNNFSGRQLNIIYLTYYDSTFGINNTVMPLQEIGNVFKFQLTDIPHEKNWYSHKTERNEEMLKFVDKIVKEHKVDVIVCYLAGHSTTENVLKQIRSYGIPMVNESLDDERKFRNKIGKDGTRKGLKNVCKYFDLSLTTSKSAIVKYLVEGGKPMYKDYAGNEKVYKKLGLEKKYDVAFVGADYGVRRKYIEYLRNNGIEVYTKGNGWEEGFSEPDEMIEIFNQAKIVLGFSTVGKNDDIFILKGRDFEVPLTGSFYITGHHEELNEYFDVGKDIETYTSKEELLQKVRYYLNNPEELEAIAVHGYEKCLNNYTAKQSYEKVFGYLGF